MSERVRPLAFALNALNLSLYVWVASARADNNGVSNQGADDLSWAGRFTDMTEPGGVDLADRRFPGTSTSRSCTEPSRRQLPSTTSGYKNAYPIPEILLPKRQVNGLNTAYILCHIRRVMYKPGCDAGQTAIVVRRTQTGASGSGRNERARQY